MSQLRKKMLEEPRIRRKLVPTYGPFRFYWDTPDWSTPSCTCTYHQDIYRQSLDSPELETTPDPDAFVEHFSSPASEDVISFPNLNHDAVPGCSSSSRSTIRLRTHRGLCQGGSGSTEAFALASRRQLDGTSIRIRPRLA